MSQLLFRSLAIGLGALTLSGPARAEDTRSVIELFTSQGCASCPPADALLRKIAGEAGTIALSFPVDYWDYIGWKDTLASPAFTARQKAYARARGDSQVYTPQAVIDGVVHVVGSDRGAIEAATKASLGRSGALTVAVNMSAVDGKVRVEVGSAPAGAAHPAGLWLLSVMHERQVAIGRGENSGHTVIYTNVVRKMTRMGDWTGQAQTFEANAPHSGDSDGYVVLLQANAGPILGAAKSDGL